MSGATFESHIGQRTPLGLVRSYAQMGHSFSVPVSREAHLGQGILFPVVSACRASGAISWSRSLSRLSSTGFWTDLWKLILQVGQLSASRGTFSPQKGHSSIASAAKDSPQLGQV